MTTHPQTNRILTALAADLDAILSSGQSGRITLNIGGGGNVRIEVAHFRDVPTRGEGRGARGDSTSESQHR